MGGDVDWERDRVRLIDAEHDLGRVAQLVDNRIPAGSDAPHDADRQQREEQSPFKRQNAVIFGPKLCEFRRHRLFPWMAVFWRAWCGGCRGRLVSFVIA